MTDDIVENDEIIYFESASAAKQIEELMEKMSREPREEMGVRRPGEKCLYEKPIKGHST